MDQALLQELLSGGSGLSLSGGLSGLQGPIVPLSGGQFGPFGFSPFAGEGNILGGGGGFGGGGGPLGPTPIGPGAAEASLGAQIGLGALGGGTGALGQGFGGDEGGPSPTVASATGGTSGDALGTLMKTLGLGKQGLEVFQKLFGGSPGSFARDPGSEGAFQAQRAGERADFTGALGQGLGGLSAAEMGQLTGLLGPLQAGEFAGPGAGASSLSGLFDAFTPGTAAYLQPGGAGFTAGLPSGGLFGPEAAGGVAAGFGGTAGGVGAGLSGLGSEAVSAGGALGAGAGAGTGIGAAGAGTAALQAIPYLGALAGIGMTALGDEPAHIKALDAAAYAGAPFTFGLTALIPTIAELTGLKGLLRGKQKVPHAVREARELQRHAGQAQGFAGEIQGATDLDTLYQTLLRHQTGYVGGTSPQAVNVGFPGRDYLGLYGGGGPAPGQRPDPWTQAQFFQNVTERPGDLFAGIQAGVRPDMLTGMNTSLADLIRGQVSRLTPPPPPPPPPILPPQGPNVLGIGGAQPPSAPLQLPWMEGMWQDPSLWQEYLRRYASQG